MPIDIAAALNINSVKIANSALTAVNQQLQTGIQTIAIKLDDSADVRSAASAITGGLKAAGEAGVTSIITTIRKLATILPNDPAIRAIGSILPEAFSSGLQAVETVESKVSDFFAELNKGAAASQTKLKQLSNILAGLSKPNGNADLSPANLLFLENIESQLKKRLKLLEDGERSQKNIIVRATKEQAALLRERAKIFESELANTSDPTRRDRIQKVSSGLRERADKVETSAIDRTNLIGNVADTEALKKVVLTELELERQRTENAKRAREQRTKDREREQQQIEASIKTRQTIGEEIIANITSRGKGPPGVFKEDLNQRRAQLSATREEFLTRSGREIGVRRQIAKVAESTGDTKEFEAQITAITDLEAARKRLRESTKNVADRNLVKSIEDANTALRGQSKDITSLIEKLKELNDVRESGKFIATQLRSNALTELNREIKLMDGLIGRTKELSKIGQATPDSVQNLIKERQSLEAQRSAINATKIQDKPEQQEAVARAIGESRSRQSKIEASTEEANKKLGEEKRRVGDLGRSYSDLLRKLNEIAGAYDKLARAADKAGDISTRDAAAKLAAETRDSRKVVRSSRPEIIKAGGSFIDAELTKADAELANVVNRTAASKKNYAAAAKVASDASKAATKTQRDLKSSVDQTNKAIASEILSFERNAITARSFGDSIALAAKRFSAFLIPSTFAFGVISAIRGATKEALEFEKVITKIQQVSERSPGGVERITSSVLSAARTTGVAAIDIAEGVQVFAQAGIKDTKQLADVANQLAKIPLSATFDDIKSTSEGLIAVFGQFNKQISDTGEILDLVNKFAADFAVESKDIFEGIKRGGSAFAIAGGDLRDFISLFSVLRETTRESSESLGTFFKFSSAQLLSSRSQKILKDIGIGPGTLTKQLSTLSDKLFGPESKSSGIERINIAESLVGSRQFNRLITLLQALQDPKIKERIAGSLSGAAGSIDETTVKRLDDIGQTLAKIRENFNAFFKELVQDESLKSFVKTIGDLTNSLIRLFSAIRPLVPVLATIGAASLLNRLRSPLAEAFRRFTNRPPSLQDLNFRANQRFRILPDQSPQEQAQLFARRRNFVTASVNQFAVNRGVGQTLGVGGFGIGLLGRSNFNDLLRSQLRTLIPIDRTNDSPEFINFQRERRREFVGNIRQRIRGRGRLAGTLALAGSAAIVPELLSPENLSAEEESSLSIDEARRRRVRMGAANSISNGLSAGLAVGVFNPVVGVIVGLTTGIIGLTRSINEANTLAKDAKVRQANTLAEAAKELFADVATTTTRTFRGKTFDDVIVQETPRKTSDIAKDFSKQLQEAVTKGQINRFIQPTVENNTSTLLNSKESEKLSDQEFADAVRSSVKKDLLNILLLNPKIQSLGKEVQNAIAASLQEPLANAVNAVKISKNINNVPLEDALQELLNNVVAFKEQIGKANIIVSKLGEGLDVRGDAISRVQTRQSETLQITSASDPLRNLKSATETEIKDLAKLAGTTFEKLKESIDFSVNRGEQARNLRDQLNIFRAIPAPANELNKNKLNAESSIVDTLERTIGAVLQSAVKKSPGTEDKDIAANIDEFTGQTFSERFRTSEAIQVKAFREASVGQEEFLNNFFDFAEELSKLSKTTIGVDEVIRRLITDFDGTIASIDPTNKIIGEFNDKLKQQRDQINARIQKEQLLAQTLRDVSSAIFDLNNQFVAFQRQIDNFAFGEDKFQSEANAPDIESDLTKVLRDIGLTRREAAVTRGRANDINVPDIGKILNDLGSALEEQRGLFVNGNPQDAERKGKVDNEVLRLQQELSQATSNLTTKTDLLIEANELYRKAVLDAKQALFIFNQNLVNLGKLRLSESLEDFESGLSSLTKFIDAQSKVGTANAVRDLGPNDISTLTGFLDKLGNVEIGTDESGKPINAAELSNNIFREFGIPLATKIADALKDLAERQRIIRGNPGISNLEVNARITNRRRDEDPENRRRLEAELRGITKERIGLENRRNVLSKEQQDRLGTLRSEETRRRNLLERGTPEDRRRDISERDRSNPIKVNFTDRDNTVEIRRKLQDIIRTGRDAFLKQELDKALAGGADDRTVAANKIRESQNQPKTLTESLNTAKSDAEKLSEAIRQAQEQYLTILETQKSLVEAEAQGIGPKLDQIVAIFEKTGDSQNKSSELIDKTIKIVDVQTKVSETLLKAANSTKDAADKLLQAFLSNSQRQIDSNIRAEENQRSTNVSNTSPNPRGSLLKNEDINLSINKRGQPENKNKVFGFAGDNNIPIDITRPLEDFKLKIKKFDPAKLQSGTVTKLPTIPSKNLPEARSEAFGSAGEGGKRIDLSKSASSFKIDLDAEIKATREKLVKRREFTESVNKVIGENTGKNSFEIFKQFKDSRDKFISLWKDISVGIDLAREDLEATFDKLPISGENHQEFLEIDKAARNVRNLRSSLPVLGTVPAGSFTRDAERKSGFNSLLPEIKKGKEFSDDQLRSRGRENLNTALIKAEERKNSLKIETPDVLDSLGVSSFDRVISKLVKLKGTNEEDAKGLSNTIYDRPDVKKGGEFVRDGFVSVIRTLIVPFEKLSNAITDATNKLNNQSNTPKEKPLSNDNNRANPSIPANTNAGTGTNAAPKLSQDFSSLITEQQASVAELKKMNDYVSEIDYSGELSAINNVLNNIYKVVSAFNDKIANNSTIQHVLTVSPIQVNVALSAPDILKMAGDTLYKSIMNKIAPAIANALGTVSPEAKSKFEGSIGS